MEVSGKRVALRLLAEEDRAALPSGFAVPECGHSLVVSRIDDCTVIGAVGYTAPNPSEGWLTIDAIELAPESRGWGYGSEAVRLLEAEATRSGLAWQFRGSVPLLNGLALYFWLRLGYRPASGDESWRRDSGRDTMAMIRQPD